MDITIRTMRREEVDLAMALAAAEGWNPGQHDAASFHAADPDGFLIAERDGRALGCISAVSYAGRFGFIGLYIVLPAYRGQGIGRRLWDAGLARLAGQVVGLDGVPAQQDFYRRSGFELAWQNVRYAGTAQRLRGAAETRLVPLGGVDFELLCADDRRVFPAPRPAFLRRWTTMADATGLAHMDGGRLAGWGLIRRCREGHKIGPLNAESPAVAQGLYAALCASVPEGEAVFLDVPLPNADAQALARALGLQPVFHTARMYLGPAPALELQRVYGVTTFELG
jgi:ribosomal protein S18 acetylase RimI-like enzyme